MAKRKKYLLPLPEDLEQIVDQKFGQFQISKENFNTLRGIVNSLEQCRNYNYSTSNPTKKQLVWLASEANLDISIFLKICTNFDPVQNETMETETETEKEECGYWEVSSLVREAVNQKNNQQAWERINSLRLSTDLFVGILVSLIDPQLESDQTELYLHEFFSHINSESIVTDTEFRHFLTFFGPIDEECSVRVHNVFGLSYFHGFLSSEKAMELVSSKGLGSYLVRFSETSWQLGKLVLNVHKKNDPNFKTVFSYNEHNKKFRFMESFYSSIDEIIHDQVFAHILQVPIPSPKYNNNTTLLDE